MIELKTSEDWSKSAKYKHICIMDPDGWDRSNFDFSFKEEFVDEAEFRHRLAFSTTFHGVRK